MLFEKSNTFIFSCLGVSLLITRIAFVFPLLKIVKKS